MPNLSNALEMSKKTPPDINRMIAIKINMYFMNYGQKLGNT